MNTIEEFCVRCMIQVPKTLPSDFSHLVMLDSNHGGRTVKIIATLDPLGKLVAFFGQGLMRGHLNAFGIFEVKTGNMFLSDAESGPMIPGGGPVVSEGAGSSADGSGQGR